MKHNDDIRTYKNGVCFINGYPVKTSSLPRQKGDYNNTHKLAYFFKHKATGASMKTPCGHELFLNLAKGR